MLVTSDSQEAHSGTFTLHMLLGRYDTAQYKSLRQVGFMTTPKKQSQHERHTKEKFQTIDFSRGYLFNIFSTWSDAPNAISSRFRHISGTKFHQIFHVRTIATTK